MHTHNLWYWKRKRRKKTQPLLSPSDLSKALKDEYEKRRNKQKNDVAHLLSALHFCWSFTPPIHITEISRQSKPPLYRETQSQNVNVLVNRDNEVMHERLLCCLYKLTGCWWPRCWYWNAPYHIYHLANHTRNWRNNAVTIFRSLCYGRFGRVSQHFLVLTFKDPLRDFVICLCQQKGIIILARVAYLRKDSTLTFGLRYLGIQIALVQR